MSLKASQIKHDQITALLPSLLGSLLQSVQMPIILISLNPAIVFAQLLKPENLESFLTIHSALTSFAFTLHVSPGVGRAISHTAHPIAKVPVVSQQLSFPHPHALCCFLTRASGP